MEKGNVNKPKISQPFKLYSIPADLIQMDRGKLFKIRECWLLPLVTLHVESVMSRQLIVS